jgi:hypothetical protein
MQNHANELRNDSLLMFSRRKYILLVCRILYHNKTYDDARSSCGWLIENRVIILRSHHGQFFSSFTILQEFVTLMNLVVLHQTQPGFRILFSKLVERISVPGQFELWRVAVAGKEFLALLDRHPRHRLDHVDDAKSERASCLSAFCNLCIGA